MKWETNELARAQHAMLFLTGAFTVQMDEVNDGPKILLIRCIEEDYLLMRVYSGNCQDAQLGVNNSNKSQTYHMLELCRSDTWSTVFREQVSELSFPLN
jgi:hypothetical protein